MGEDAQLAYSRLTIKGKRLFESWGAMLKEQDTLIF